MCKLQTHINYKSMKYDSLNFFLLIFVGLHELHIIAIYNFYLHLHYNLIS